MLVSSMLAGALWEVFGPSATFFAGAGFCLITLLGLALLQIRRKARS